MILVHYLIVICFLGIHYPLARWYVQRALAGLAPEVLKEIHTVLRPRLRLLFFVWSACLTVAGGAVAISLGSERVVSTAGYLSIFAFHAIWWPFVVPIFRAMEGELKRRGLERSAANAGPTRTATLKPRRAADYLPSWMRVLPIMVGVAGIGGILWRLSLYTPEESRTILLTATFGMSGIFFLVVWSVWIRREVATSYVADGPAETAPQRIAAAEALRQFRVRGISCIQTLAAAGFFSFAIACIEMERGTISERDIGIYGGIVGTLLGTSGGIFGTMASIRTHRAMRQG